MTLWVKFAGDTSLPPVLDEEGKLRLEQIFNGLDPNSPLHQSMAALGLELPLAPMLQWQENAPYINWTAIIDTISGGWVTAYGENDYKIRKSPLALLRFLKIQFRISLYLARTLKADIPSSSEKQIIESLSLGFVSLALTFRLPREPQLAELLAQPPANLRKTLAQIQAVQLRRTKLTPAWQALFPWREEAEDASAFSENYEGRKEWQGIPISGGQVTACLHLQQTESNEPVVYAFKRARPETVELFPGATAILYGEGGAMSHACTVAREMNLTCVTALGPDFYRDMQALAASQKNVWLIVDGQTGKVGLVN
jgi:hypothetical protein